MSRDNDLVLSGFILGFLSAVIVALFILLFQTLYPEPREPALCKPVSMEQYEAMLDAYAAKHKWSDLDLDGFNKKYCLTP